MLDTIPRILIIKNCFHYCDVINRIICYLIYQGLKGEHVTISIYVVRGLNMVPKEIIMRAFIRVEEALVVVIKDKNLVERMAKTIIEGMDLVLS